MLVAARTANVFLHDPELLYGLPAQDAAAVTESGEVRVIRSNGTRIELEAEPSGGFGLLVLEGFMCRTTRLAERESMELLGAGDVLRPWDDDRALAPVPVTSAHRVLAPVRLGVLDHEFALAVSPWPSVAEAICGRFVDRVRWLALQLALTRVRRIEDRLCVLLWHLADRWGRVRRDGTIVCSVPLTHGMLAAMVGAQRPTVTTALTAMALEGRVSRHGKDWALHGDPPTTSEIEGRALSDAFRLRRQD
jgi:CRP/FNR family transcriptional regulator, cyclic AMP receptor protein